MVEWRTRTHGVYQNLRVCQFDQLKPHFLAAISHNNRGYLANFHLIEGWTSPDSLMEALQLVKLAGTASSCTPTSSSTPLYCLQGRQGPRQDLRRCSMALLPSSGFLRNENWPILAEIWPKSLWKSRGHPYWRIYSMIQYTSGSAYSLLW